ncbi:hypothetical protein RHECIAT_CH0002209 [Rhizobium etli CIAT 652]|uniref:Uncharacterized protein n=1 Tax=Rhizobium etli (strain CIAT 652) TaxID=491916 RepID=B3Q0G2_RHIE6|nr:hypothetical protein RHECIAT_CH0002209 [Rhizobium etli CIAT 652]
MGALPLLIGNGCGCPWEISSGGTFRRHRPDTALAVQLANLPDGKSDAVVCNELLELGDRRKFRRRLKPVHETKHRVACLLRVEEREGVPDPEIGALHVEPTPRIRRDVEFVEGLHRLQIAPVGVFKRHRRSSDSSCRAFEAQFGRG